MPRTSPAKFPELLRMSGTAPASFPELLRMSGTAPGSFPELGGMSGIAPASFPERFCGYLTTPAIFLPIIRLITINPTHLCPNPPNTP